MTQPKRRKLRAFQMDVIPERMKVLGCAWKKDVTTKEKERCGCTVRAVYLLPSKGVLGGRLVRVPVCREHEKRIRRDFRVGNS